EEAQAQASRSVPQFFLHGNLLKPFSTEQLCLATLKLWWYVVTVRLSFASRLEVELDSLRDALSGRRVT
ncbi:hypothetical protein Goklo_001605, partial [Gossypium klotzschianum]|nr:hypothetical protein [Gossypium klotzschianum]